MYRLHQETELLRQLAPHATNARQQFAALRLVHQAHQPEADFQANLIHGPYILPRQLFLIGMHDSGRRGRGYRNLGCALGAVVEEPGAKTARSSEQQECKIGHARYQSHHAQQTARNRQTLRLPEQLFAQLTAQVLGARHASDDDRDTGG
jgi:hypothetical protein